MATSKRDVGNTSVVASSQSATSSESFPDINGGLISVEKGIYTMNGGTISGLKGNLGGAIYVGSGATLILNGGTIETARLIMAGLFMWIRAAH